MLYDHVSDMWQKLIKKRKKEEGREVREDEKEREKGGGRRETHNMPIKNTHFQTPANIFGLSRPKYLKREHLLVTHFMGLSPNMAPLYWRAIGTDSERANSTNANLQCKHTS